jgi:hypothetical protein
VEEYEAFNPVGVGLFGPEAEVFEASDIADLI